ncbi:MAG: Peptidyl-prolyl cis-trans isomerase [Candidatus Jorgensenbacteria bacterium GW2011_GWA2_45_9]|uniref:Peptidyl-prolyl cis-trans isomerase n=1 Tax=Candidatus Jorgensenbacteria bacterium GW2011_GWA2_45_9 TaxID=1618663 RepID=A0A0G1QDB9_9BACT|nr:MAG: Peptidyl-prolyl cis-trans isomerase [Candidatus Jorgensenbacteria bacterium GW2011_GWA2_45_9]
MNSNKTSYILAGVAGLIAVVIVFMASQNNNKVDGNAAVEQVQKYEQVNTSNGLIIEDEIVGTGTEAIPGRTAVVNYIGKLTDGKKFDSSYDRGEPFSFTLGAGQVIRGWDEGVLGMKVGGKRKLTIPPELGYGAQDIGNGLIPPNSTLIFDVELLDVK